jgi:hypothetical protein
MLLAVCALPLFSLQAQLRPGNGLGAPGNRAGQSTAEAFQNRPGAPQKPRSAADWHELDWQEPQTVILPGGQSVTRPTFRGAFTNRENGFPLYRFQENLPAAGSWTVRVVDAVYEPLPPMAAGLTDDAPAWPDGVEPRSWTMTSARQPVGVVTLVPIRRNPATGLTERLLRFRLEARFEPRSAANTAAANASAAGASLQQRSGGPSVLATGRWFKIAVARDGVYRIDRDFLESLGVNLSALDPQRLAVFGNGGGMVPEDNAVPYPDDLVENATLLVGGEDGSFDAGDYLLFYGQGPDRLRFDGLRFRQQKNLYSDQTYYFLTIDQGSGIRVQALGESPASPGTTVTAFDDVAFYDADEENLLKSGRQWFGDFFDVFTPTRSYSFTFPDRVAAEPVWIEALVAARSAVASSNFNLSVNGSTLLTFSLPVITIGFDRLYASSNTSNAEVVTAGDNLSIQLRYTSDATARGWLDYLVVNARRNLRMPAAGGLSFRDARSATPGGVAEFRLANASGVSVWEVSDPTRPQAQQGSFSGAEFRWRTDVGSGIREYFAFRSSDILPSSQLVSLGGLANQDLHNPSRGFPDLIVVSHPSFADQARRIAGFHADQDGLDTLVALTPAVYNEFGNGAPDPSAVRNFVRMFYERAATDEQLPRYLLLFGDGSYDSKNLDYDASVNQNFVPTFQSQNSTNPIASFTSDDFFGFLDPGEGGSNITQDTLGIDIGIGRFPVKTDAEARAVVDKVIHYASEASLGSWRNMVTFVADDEDGDLHRRDADRIANEQLAAEYPVYNVDKIYLDAYQQTSASGGERYPDANEAISNRMFSGTLIMNYTGHGSEQSWAKERVLSESDISNWTNIDKLALFITATCSFSRYDNPAATSAGEQTLLHADGGAIALITTVRLVLSNANFETNREVFRTIFEPMPDGSRPALGDVVRLTKLGLATGPDLSDGDNNRKFTLLGDPALRLAYPTYDVVTTTVNGFPADGAVSDTLRGLAKVLITGEVRDDAGNRLESFDGTVFPTIYDKASTLATLSNDGSISPVRQFELQKNIIYRGRASVTGGSFQYEFIVPKDISYSFGKGKVSYYADNGVLDAHGFDTTVVIGGTADSIAADNAGPEVRVFLNEENFAFGGITDEQPILLVKLQDESGINTVGNGIGHDITAVIDENTQNTLTLNEFYESDLDSYQSGSLQYRLSTLEPGRHSIRLKAWDVHNNSGEGYTEFVVAESSELALRQILNYPNPFTTRTEFMFEHNRPGDMMQVMVEIFTVSGKRIKTLVQDVVTDGYRIDGILWDGLDDFGDTIGRGVYVYKVSVRSLSDPSARASAFEKLVLLR